MKEDLQDIGDLYRNEFEDAPFEFDKTNWVAIQPQLDKMQFFHFSFFRFNIYYLSVIVVSFLLSAYSIIYFVSGNRNAKEHTQNVFVNTVDSVVKSADSVLPGEVIDKRVFSGSNSVKRKPSDFINIIKPEHYVDESIEKSGDSSVITKANTYPAQINENAVKDKENKITEEKVDVLYIIKQDTIVVVDTINSTTARRRMKKK